MSQREPTVRELAAMKVFEEYSFVPFTPQNRSQIIEGLERALKYLGCTDVKIVIDNASSTEERLVGDIYLKPKEAAEFITIDFDLKNSGVEFHEPT